MVAPVHEWHCCLPAVVGSVWRRAGQMAASTRGRQASSTEKDIEEALAPPTPLQKLGKKTKTTIKKLQVCLQLCCMLHCCILGSERRPAALTSPERHSTENPIAALDQCKIPPRLMLASWLTCPVWVASLD